MSQRIPPERIEEQLRAEGLVGGSERWKERYWEIYDVLREAESTEMRRQRGKTISSFLNIMAIIPGFGVGILAAALWGTGPGIVIGFLVYFIMAGALRKDSPG